MAAPLILKDHAKDLGGGFTVRRLLPAAQARSVGPFIFFDHFGPVRVQPQDQHDVRPHPHIGLATVTYLFEGALMHRDSLGSVQRIEPGAVNWMSAGRGIVHSERRPADLADKPYTNHGLQLWLALPQAQEESEPAFSHTPAADVPEFSVGGAAVRLLAGRLFGVQSPVVTHGAPVYLDIALDAGQAIHWAPLAEQGVAQAALYPLRAGAEVNGVKVAAGHMAVIDTAEPLTLRSEQAQPVVLIGGAPLDGPRHMWWNFVSSRPERIAQAAQDWAADRFPAVPGEHERIPLPERKWSSS